jgi:hypothetical protein
MTWGWYQATKRPSFVGGPAGNGVGGGVGVAVGGRVGFGGAAVADGCRGECSGECNGESNAVVAVGVPDGVGVAVAVGEAVGVNVDTAGPDGDPGDGVAVPSPSDWPQAARKAARAVAPAPFRKRRRSIRVLFFVMCLL